ncbi:ankyrin repeat domain-containing protein [Legionella fairfieldensis]|uniref:ankyrin repeat domain-containing protein n=1 Tax=Legionella fairfieldensis TaxID=45064 RepID=UPI00048B0929|nr:ankyrin repeat domain-containing protein [Legionella fairfieldensis]
MTRESFEENLDIRRFTQLHDLILQRQEFESKHSTPPYSLHRTDFNFTDVEGNTLLHYAAAIGDIDKIKSCLENNANINLKNNLKQTAISMALENGHLDAANFLFQQGASCIDLNLSSCKKDKKLIEWLSEKIKNALHQSFPNPANNYRNSLVDNQFFSESSLYYSSLKRAAEIGDIEFIKAVMDSNKLFQQTIDFLLVVAAGSGQLKIVEYLYKNNANLNSQEKYVDTALIEATKQGQQDVIDFLLEKKVDVNQENHKKNTALTFAIINNDKETVSKLVMQGASLGHVDVDGNTLLHLAIINHCKIIKELLTIQGFNELVKIKNIYGFTPLDLAIQNKRAELIRLWVPECDLEIIKKDSNYGVKPTAIYQTAVRRKMFYWLKLNYRDVSYFDSVGHCNGFSYLKSFYSAKDMEQYYFDTLALMSNWDGREDTLKKPFKERLQAKFYQNLDELFEQWTNDVIWFQHSLLEEIDQLKSGDRVGQYSMIKGNNQGNYDYIPLYIEELTFSKRTEAQLLEMFSYLMRMPVNTYFELGGGNHLTSGYKSQKEILVYYDPNFTFKPEDTENIKPVIQRIIDFKYILLRRFEEDEASCIFRIFCYQKDLPGMDLDSFAVLDENELPKSKEDSVSFQKNSANNFTPLHIAVMTRSLLTVQKLLADGFCDVNAKDHLERRAVEIAFDSGFSEAITLFLETSSINLDDFDKLMKEAYCKKQTDVVQTVLTSPHARNLNRLLMSAIKNEDIDLVEKLFSEDKANINQMISFYRAGFYQLPLTEAIKTNNLTIVQYLLKSGADPFMNAEGYTPLNAAFSPGSRCAELIISHLKDVNQQDSTGHTAIHYATACANVDAMKKLIDKGAHLKLKTSEGKTIFDCLEDRIFFNENESQERDCLKLLIINYDFCLTDSNDKKILIDLLIKSAGEEDNELYQLIMSKCNKEIINQTTIKGKPLLHYFMINRKFHRIESLLEKGAFVDALFSSGNTPLMGFIKAKDLPEKYDLIPLFIKYKSDVTIKNKEGKTAIDLVNESDDDKIKEIFYDSDLLEKSTRPLI